MHVNNKFKNKKIFFILIIIFLVLTSSIIFIRGYINKQREPFVKMVSGTEYVSGEAAQVHLLRGLRRQLWRPRGGPGAPLRHESSRNLSIWPGLDMAVFVGVRVGAGSHAGQGMDFKSPQPGSSEESRVGDVRRK